MDNKNIVKVYTTSSGAELNISAPSTKQVITATNNKAQLFAEQAKKYRDEAKMHRDNAKYYAEQNSDVTLEYIDSVQATLEDKLTKMQPAGNYALREELPINVSELKNDAEYVSKVELEIKAEELSLPSQEGCNGYFLMSDGEKESWVGINSFQLFDTVLKDHVLTYEESKGLALQGTYVYKDAVAGSRYGYPDFYNKCLEEYSNSNNTYEILRNNYEVVGSPTITEDGVASGFSGGNSIFISDLDFITSDFEIISPIINYYTPITNSQMIFAITTSSLAHLSVRINNGNLGFLINGDNNLGILRNFNAIPITQGNKYQTKFVYKNNTFYVYYRVNNGGWILYNSYNVATQFTFDIARRLYLGCENGNSNFLTNGSIDLKQFSITVYGEGVYRAVDYITTNPNGHRFYPISSKTLIDSTYEQTGMAWMYGIDQENERIFLPRNVWFEQMSMNDVGKAVEAGLPNITGKAKTTTIFNNTRKQGGTVGAITTAQTGTIALSSGGGEQGLYSLSIDASMANNTYGKSDTVQPNAVKKLLYICVGNTVAQSTITDVVDVTTTENDTIPLLTGMYFDFTPNNISWVKAGEQRNSGGVYTFCYNELVNELTNPKYDIKVVEIKNMIAGIDYSEYWKVNQDDMTFVTPTAISCIVVEQATSQLYFKVANAVQNLELIDVARIEATKANKTDVDGQWVDKRSTLSEAVAIGKYTLDLSDYLPNDCYIYEVWGQCYLSRSDSSGVNTNVYIRDGFGTRDVIAQTMADGANFQQGTCQFLLTVDTQRTIQVEITNMASAACVVYVYKYRRLGTNQ